MGDGAYRHEPRCITPFSAPEVRDGGMGGLWKYDFNKRLRAERVVIEWVFARVKGTWGRFAVQWPGTKIEKLCRTVRASFLLFNFLCHVRGNWPLHDPAFSPALLPVRRDDCLTHIWD